MGESSDRKFLGMIAYRLPGWFAHLPDQTQYNRRPRIASASPTAP